jgi:hypothetical protein
MAKCRQCGNTTNFNVWCNIRKILEVELDENNNLYAIVGEPVDEALKGEEISIVDGDIEFAIVSCAWCGSTDIEKNKGEKIINVREQ